MSSSLYQFNEKERLRIKTERATGRKVCKVCKLEKPFSEFPKVGKSGTSGSLPTGGVARTCKECLQKIKPRCPWKWSEWNKWLANHPGKQQEKWEIRRRKSIKLKEWRAKHPEIRIKERLKYWDNPVYRARACQYTDTVRKRREVYRKKLSDQYIKNLLQFRYGLRWPEITQELIEMQRDRTRTTRLLKQIREEIQL